MKYVDRQLKGTYGYIRKQFRFELIKTIILFAAAFGIFFIGYLTLHTKRSLWSVFAVLALLPASKSLVGVIMFARFRSLTEDVYDRYSRAVSGITTLYENIITTRERSFYIPVICINGHNVFCYRPKDESSKDALKDHMDNVFKTAGYNVTFKIFDDEEAFLARAVQIRDKQTDEAVLSAKIADTIKAVSL